MYKSLSLQLLRCRYQYSPNSIHATKVLQNIYSIGIFPTIHMIRVLQNGPVKLRISKLPVQDLSDALDQSYTEVKES